MISIRNLTRRYGSILAVDDVSLEVGRGEIVGLLGHNGAGKTTVMKILTGFLEASDGSVSVGGIDVASDRAGVQRQIGYLPENAPLYPEMLVQEYLSMMAELRGVPADRSDAAVASAAVSVGVQDHLVRPIHTLSKGYRQRVGLAQAILHEPPVLVLDEPTNGLDPVQIQTIRELILKLSERATIILSTHILQEIEAVCDRVLVMIEGRLVEDSPLAALVSEDALRLELRSGAENVESRVGNVAGVLSVEPAAGARRGDVAYTVRCDVEQRPVPAILDVARHSGWVVDSIAREGRSLESVFNQLQDREAEARRAAEAGQ